MASIKNLLLFPFLGVFYVCYAQDIKPLSEKDSAEFLVALATKKCLNNQLVHAEMLARRAYRHAVAVNYREGEAKAMFMLGTVLKDMEKNEASIDAYLKAAHLSEILHDSSRAGKAYNNAAGIYIFKLNHYTTAYQYCLRAISLLQRDTVYIPYAWNNFATLRMRTGKMDEAMELFKKQYEAERRNNHVRGMSLALANIATVHSEKKEFASAVGYYEKALSIARATDDAENTANVLIGLSQADCGVGSHAASKAALDEALKLCEQHSLYDLQIATLHCLGREAMHLKTPDAAMTYAKDALYRVNKYKREVFRGDTYKQLSEICTSIGKTALALEYHQRYSRFQDSLANQERLAVARLPLKAPEARNTGKSDAANPFLKYVVAATAAGFLFIVLRYVRHRRRKLTTKEDGGQYDAEEVVSTGNSTAQPVPDGTRDDKGQRESEASPGVALQHIEVVNGAGIKLLCLEDVFWFQKENKGYHVLTRDVSYRIKQNIGELEQMLPRSRFFRINRSVIINIDQMSNYSFWENHKYIIRMKDPQKTEFIISRNRLKEMKEIFMVLETQ